MAVVTGPHTCKHSEEYSLGGGRLTNSNMCFTLKRFPKVPDAKQGNKITNFRVLGITPPGIEP